MAIYGEQYRRCLVCEQEGDILGTRCWNDEEHVII